MGKKEQKRENRKVPQFQFKKNITLNNYTEFDKASLQQMLSVSLRSPAPSF